MDLTLRRPSSTPANANPTYRIHIKADGGTNCGTHASAPASCPAAAVVGTLTNPAQADLPGQLGTVRIAAPGGGIDLAAGTTYWLVVEVSTGSSWWRIGTTKAHNQTSDASVPAGWDIGKASYQRDANGWIASGGGGITEPFKMALYGYEKALPPPQLTGATASGDRLRLTFSETLDPGSVPDAAAFEVTVDDGAPAGSADVGISGRVAVLTLAEAVEPGAAVTVGYDPARAGGNPLRGVPGNEVAAFSDRPVINPAMAETQRRVFAGALAALASRTVAGALDNIGARLGDAVPASGLALAGRSVPFGGAGAGGFDGHGPSGGVRSRGMEAGDLLRASAFSLASGAAEDGGGLDPAALRWGIWGRGDYGSFEGRPEPGARYEGETRTGWLGADARAGRWVAGLAVSRGTSGTDYGFEGGDAPGERGRLETALTALWPYGRWRFADGLELRGLAGAGRGRLRHTPDGDDARETSRLSMRMGSLGLSQRLSPLEGLALAVRTDASFARMETAKGGEAVDGLRADAWRLRGGVEASRRFVLEDGGALAPFMEAAARRDGGDGLTGSGLELAGGLRYAAPGLAVEARGRWLAAHSAKGARERGASVAVRLDPAAGGRGLSLSLTPRWGAPAGGAGALWRDEMPKTAGVSEGGGALDARLGYGFALAPEAGGLLTPFAEAGLAGADDRRLRLGARFEAGRGALALELSGERRESAAARPEHAARLELRLGF